MVRVFFVFLLLSWWNFKVLAFCPVHGLRTWAITKYNVKCEGTKKYTSHFLSKRLGRMIFHVSASNAGASGFDWKAIKKGCEDKLQKCIDSLQLQFQTIRVGAANPMMLDRVSVNYYGVPTALNQVARVTVSPGNSQQLLVEPFEKSTLPDIEKAILTAELNLTPQSDGNFIRINIPPLTEERRKELVKQAKSMVEGSKIALRNVRRDFVEKVKNAEKRKEIGKDENKTYQDNIQKVTDVFVKKIDDLMTTKEKDLLKV